MKLGRFCLEEKCFFGLLDDQQVQEIEDISTPYTKTGKVYALQDLAILPPCLPSKIVGVGLNYLDHIKEMNVQRPKQPVLFMKPNTTIIGSEESIEYPSVSKQVEYEGELAIIIGSPCHHVSLQEARHCILGYTCANDVTARDLQQLDGQWTRAKGFNTFLPLGPYIETEIHHEGLEIKSFVNQDKKQHGNTSNLVFSVPELVCFISSIMILYPGDVILTGTPAGVGPILPGDMVEIEIDGIGKLRNKVILAR